MIYQVIPSPSGKYILLVNDKEVYKGTYIRCLIILGHITLGNELSFAIAFANQVRAKIRNKSDNDAIEVIYAGDNEVTKKEL